MLFTFGFRVKIMIFLKMRFTLLRLWSRYQDWHSRHWPDGEVFRARSRIRGISRTTIREYIGVSGPAEYEIRGNTVYVSIDLRGRNTVEPVNAATLSGSMWRRTHIL